MEKETETMRDILKFGLQALGLGYDEAIYQSFHIYQHLLLEWNQKFNLTAITDPREIFIKHFLDSLTIVPDIPIHESLADVGSGAGFPGIPLKIMGHAGPVVLMDSLAKRVGFLEEVIRALSLENISALHIRAEDAGRNPRHRESYGVAVTRAVSSLRVVSEYGIPLVKVGGSFIAMQGKEPDETEACGNALSILGGTLESIRQVTLPFDGILRHNLCIRKISVTPSEYPRRAGVPVRKPL